MRNGRVPAWTPSFSGNKTKQLSEAQARLGLQPQSYAQTGVASARGEERDKLRDVLAKGTVGRN